MRLMIDENLNRKVIESFSKEIFEDTLLKNLSQRNISIWVKKKKHEYQVVFQIDQSHFGFAKFKSQSENLSTAFLECEKKAKRWIIRSKKNRGKQFNRGVKHLNTLVNE